MKKSHFLILIFLASSIVNAGYQTPGNGKRWTLDSLVTYSGGTVTFSTGTYFINDTLTITSPDTIFVGTNARVKVASLVTINVLGVLKINPPDSVKFTAIDTALKFVGFRFYATSGASVLKKMIFEYANSIRIVGANILIDSCIIRFNTLVNSASSGAISVFQCNPIISNCKIIRNRRSGIISAANADASPIIIKNLISENNVFNENYPQINLGRGSATSPIIISGNLIVGLYDQAGGISISTLAGGNTPDCIVSDNNIRRNRYGIAFLGSNINGVVTNNIIDSNRIENMPLRGGSGLNFNGTSTQTIKVRKNVIRWNLWGVTIQGTAKPMMGDLSNPDSLYIGLNRIHWNVHNDSTIDLYNNTPDSIKAENNWWGTINLDTVEAHIVHEPDISSLGFVDYLPISTVSQIPFENAGTINYYKLYDAYPNPFNPYTVIRFQLPVAGHVSLKIYDMLGKEITTLVNKKLAPGTYSVDWNASQYPSGIYFYTLDVNDFRQSKKLILIK